MRNPLAQLVLAFVLLVVGLGTATWYGPSQLAAARASASWDEVPATVVSTRVEERRGSKDSTDWAVVVRYAWAVDGARHEGERWSAVGERKVATRADADELARAWRAGDALSARVDPDDPSSAVLSTGGAGKAWATIAFGALLAVAAVVILLRRVRAGRLF